MKKIILFALLFACLLSVSAAASGEASGSAEASGEASGSAEASGETAVSDASGDISAASATYHIDDLGMSIDFPSNYYVFTGDAEENYPVLDVLGMTSGEIAENMQSNSLYIDALDASITSEITIVGMTTAMKDFTLYDDSEILDMEEATAEQFETQGMSLNKYEIYQHSQAKFIAVHCSRAYGTGTVYILAYLTCYDNKEIVITYHSFTGEIDPSAEALMQSIIDSVHFDVDPMIVSASSTFRHTSFSWDKFLPEVIIAGIGGAIAGLIRSSGRKSKKKDSAPEIFVDMSKDPAAAPEHTDNTEGENRS